jgi:hypothetical protein
VLTSLLSMSYVGYGNHSELRINAINSEFASAAGTEKSAGVFYRLPVLVSHCFDAGEKCIDIHNSLYYAYKKLNRYLL